MSGPATSAPDLRGLRLAIVNWRDPWHPEAGGAERYAWQAGRGLAARGVAVHYVTARAAGQARRDRHDGITLTRLGGRFTVYPLVLGWLLGHRRSFDAVLDCQNGIPFFTPWVLPRRVPVLCLVHHVHTAQFGVHFPRWMAWAGRILEGPVARRAYRRHACVAVSPSTVTAMRERLRWTGDIYLVPNGAPAPASGTEPPSMTGPASGAAPVGAATPASVTGPASAMPVSAPAVGGAPRPASGPATATAKASPSAPANAAVGYQTPATLSWVGRLVVHKRAELILPVAQRLAATGLAIDVVGRGPAAAGLAGAVAASGLSGAVRLHGFLPEAGKQEIVARSLLHLNTSQGEGWGLCVLEAAALGVPTVAYDVDGLRDAVRDGHTGWLVRAGEAIEDVTERAVKELADPARRRAIAAECRDWAASLDWDRSVARLAALIKFSVHYGTSRSRHPGAWIVSGADGADLGGAAPDGAAPVGVGLDGAAPVGVGLDGAAPVGVGLDGAAPVGVGLDGAAPVGVGLDGAAPVGVGPAWAGPDGGGQAGVLAEGPVLDALLEAHPDGLALREATPLERLLGHAARQAGDAGAAGKAGGLR